MIIFNHLYLYPSLFFVCYHLKGSKNLSLSLLYLQCFLRRESDIPLIGNALNENIEVEVEF